MFQNTNKTCIITGGNAGIGKETAKRMVNANYNVIIACRGDDAAVQAAIQEIETATNKPGSVRSLKLDLSSQESIKSFVNTFLETNTPLDTLINNAGLYGPPYSKTKDGLEMQFGVNHIGPFLLTNLLLPKLSQSSEPRVVVVGSRAHNMAGGLDFDNLSVDEKGYSPIKYYNKSKLCNLLFTYELNRRLQEKKSNITVNVIHPGVVQTNLFKNLNPAVLFVMKLGSLFFTTVETSADAVSNLAIGKDPALKDVKGQYFSLKDKVASSRYSLETSNWSKLWEKSCAIVGIPQDIQL
ncbi:hypothetical protein CYY_007709 [Polysphondylium violaceum]|uniref:Uncharacterized protein n=1 Tax=Polysphondylium violaceum TaxID=133409 RepID=A0A8J4PWU6_9MYCE|nr:hypothetical protein CYY_007709 [Polysphondylium violaceum]